MKYYFIAGEASGDLHGGLLIQALKKEDTAAIIRGWGGDKMEAQGMALIKHYRDLSFMGFVEVLKNIKTIVHNLTICKKDILAFKPDAIVLVDYPGFNLRMAKWAKQQQIPVIYYIAPQVWAWKENRVKAMKKNIDLMLTILPFEKKYFKDIWNWDVTFVGHPLIDVVDEYKSSHTPLTIGNKPIIAVLPGSRKQLIPLQLPMMLSIAPLFPHCHFVVAKANSLEDIIYDSFISLYPNVSSIRNDTYKLIASAHAAIVASGTATLETALIQTPEIVCYKGSSINYMIARRLIKVPYISLVNLILQKEVVKELIQYDFNTENLATFLKNILANEQYCENIKDAYCQLRSMLYIGKPASQVAAQKIVEFMSLQRK